MYLKHRDYRDAVLAFESICKSNDLCHFCKLSRNFLVLTIDSIIFTKI